MAKAPNGKQSDREERARSPHEPLEALVRLLAQVSAREDFAACSREALAGVQGNGGDGQDV